MEREALKLAVQWPALTGPEFDTLGAAAFSVPAHAAVFGVIAGCGGVGTAGRARDWAAALLEAAPDDRARTFVTELAVEPLQVAGEPDEKYADVILARVGELAVGREIAAIKAKLQRMNPEEDQAAYGRMFGDLVALEQRHKVAARPGDRHLTSSEAICNLRDIAGCTYTDCAQVKPQVRVIKLGPP